MSSRRPRCGTRLAGAACYSLVWFKSVHITKAPYDFETFAFFFFRRDPGTPVDLLNRRTAGSTCSRAIGTTREGAADQWLQAQMVEGSGRLPGLPALVPGLERRRHRRSEGNYV